MRAHRLGVWEQHRAGSGSMGPEGQFRESPCFRPGTGDEAVPLTTFDKFVEQWDFGRLDFIKIDIEGSELRFLEGASGSLRRFRPMLLLEINSTALATFGADPENVLRFLTDLGYRIFLPTMRDVRKLSPIAKMATYEFFNVIAIPERT